MPISKFAFLESFYRPDCYSMQLPGLVGECYRVAFGDAGPEEQYGPLRSKRMLSGSHLP